MEPTVPGNDYGGVDIPAFQLQRRLSTGIILAMLAGVFAPAIAAGVVTTLYAGSLSAALPCITAIALASVLSACTLGYILRTLVAPVDELSRTLEFYRKNGVDVSLPEGDGEHGNLGRTIDGLLSSIRTELHESRDAADTDPLTGLLNRRGFDRRRKPGSDGSIIFVDLDSFKQVNDRLGHDAGDLVLSATADLLRSVLREGELVARFGGEEFVVFLPGIDMNTARLVAERIRTTAEEKLRTELGRITISAGVSHVAEGEAFSAALARADSAAYAAKNAGKNCVRTHLDVTTDKTATLIRFGGTVTAAQ